MFVELKAVGALDKVQKAQCINRLKTSGINL